MAQGSVVRTKPPEHGNAHRDEQRSREGLHHGKIESLHAVGHQSDLGHEGHSQRPDVRIDMPVSRPAGKEEGPRDVYLSKEDFRNFGFTEGCDGCSRLAAGMASRPHTSKSRERMKEEMKKTPEGRRRLEKADREIHEYLESKLMEEHGTKDEAERPGITGSKPEARPKPSIEAEPAVADQPSMRPGTGGDTPSAHPGASGSGSSPSPPRASSRKPCNGSN